jgi:hypothetical protein
MKVQTKKVSARKYMLLPKEDVKLIVTSNVKLRMWLVDFITACHKGTEANMSQLIANARAFYQQNAAMHTSVKRGMFWCAG